MPYFIAASIASEIYAPSSAPPLIRAYMKNGLKFLMAEKKNLRPRKKKPKSSPATGKSKKRNQAEKTGQKFNKKSGKVF